ncbi:putative toxin-antitoxin system toxin component, PIN family [Actimicrobium antarcticum]|uniref:PIN domain-containing protein n=1 Tax=Actimicrobium antarcticum TaxID=1051899 RepID=A0ABP7TPH7_9BURK
MIPNRIVIDTNVCLDLFVFHDPRWHAMLAAMRDRSIEAVTRTDCRTEWLIVLGYPHLPLDPESRQTCTEQFDALIRCLPFATPAGDVARLPVCKDRDDQKFLELARDAEAAVLITKDKALLKLAGKTRRNGLFLILTPEAWTAMFTNISGREE